MTTSSKSFYAPKAPCSATLVVKKSTFIAYAFCIDNRDALVFHMEQLQKQYPDARHICSAYIIGDPKNTTSAGFDDDGEPTGTAGRPILNVLQHKNIGNVAVFVVRYFGGIKLGAGGLVRAYAGATQAVVQNMELTEPVVQTTFCVQADFANEQQIRHYIGQYQGSVLDVVYQDQVQLLAKIDTQYWKEFCQNIALLGSVHEPDFFGK